MSVNTFWIIWYMVVIGALILWLGSTLSWPLTICTSWTVILSYISFTIKLHSHMKWEIYNKWWDILNWGQYLPAGLSLAPDFPLPPDFAGLTTTSSSSSSSSGSTFTFPDLAALAERRPDFASGSGVKELDVHATGWGPEGSDFIATANHTKWTTLITTNQTNKELCSEIPLIEIPPETDNIFGLKVVILILR